MRGGVPCDMTSSCVQGGIPRLVGGFQPNVMMGPSSPATAWQFHSALPKQEPVDHEDRNDSGINSSSPGSDHSENMPYSRPTPQTDRYSTPLTRTGKPASLIHHQQQILNDQNLLTPPISEPMASPKEQDQPDVINAPLEGKSEPMDTEQQSLTSYAALDEARPSESPLKRPYFFNAQNALKELQSTLEKKCLLLTPPSPKISECSDETKSDNDVDEDDERELKVSKASHGRVKTFKCKECDFVTFTKEDYWKHLRNHIPPDKRLDCPQCIFVTKYKHHLEYHLRNHVGSRPFKCPHCKYRGINKSTLNSHLKSHSNVYQYSCADCKYVNKYCHSFKLHLRKYGHKPGMVLNPDGTPNPLPIIDVYGTRRGPKLKIQESKPTEEPNPEQVLPFPLNQMMFNAPQLQLPFPAFPFFPAFPGGIPNSLLLQNLENIAKGQAGLLPPQEQLEQPEESSSSSLPDMEVLDLSKPDETVQKNRRKGRAFKLTPTHDNISDDEEETTMFSNVEVVEEKPQTKEETEEAKSEKEAANNDEEFTCQYCRIKYGDAVLYTMHMGYHGYNNPFTCNMCGEECQDKVSFFLHIARTPHS